MVGSLTPLVIHGDNRAGLDENDVESFIGTNLFRLFTLRKIFAVLTFLLDEAVYAIRMIV